MISRALARDISDFQDLLESHLARLIHALHARTNRKPRGERERIVQDAIVIAFRRRETFDPQLESVAVWFTRCVEEASLDYVAPDADELLMLQALTPATPATADPIATPSSYEGGVAAAAVPRGPTDASQKPGKECPPCWRCRYFDGWLPRGEVKVTVCADPGVYEAIKNLDRRKIEIANYVRGEYPEELLED